MFYLQAPRELGEPEIRHRNASIGHAVSTDLRSWEVLQDALKPGAERAFDDLATWTGSVTPGPDGKWLMFYTGISSAEDGAVQRIGAASSTDLISWERVDAFVLEADARWYEKLSDGAREETWRDPWALRDSSNGRYHLFITARVNRGPLDGRGVIGHAWSDDLEHWEIGPPVSQSGEFAHLEVPQVEYLGGRYRMIFSAQDWTHSARRLARSGVIRQSGTHYLVADDLLGPYRLERDDFLSSDPTYYSGRLVKNGEHWALMASRNYRQDGTFAGELADPMPLWLDTDGQLRIDRKS